MILLLSSIVLTLFIFKNSLYFTIALLLITFVMLGYLSLYGFISFLSSFILIVVYVGAIIILIGYICAVRPNLVLEPNFNFIYLFPFLVLPSSFLSPSTFTVFSCTTHTLADFFYSFEGLFIFSSLVLILFVTLLIVTSQYRVPRGPFRSLFQ